MLTISSPPVSDFEVARRAEVIGRAIDAARAARPAGLRDRRFSGVLVHPSTVAPAFVERLARSLLQHLADAGIAEDGQFVGMLGAGVVDFRLAAGVRRAEAPGRARPLGGRDLRRRPAATRTSGPASSSRIPEDLEAS